MSHPKITPTEAQLLQETINSDTKTVDIRLRQGEYQYELAKELASFQLELKFPDAKELIKKIYGEEKANDDGFIRNIQTILKKMEKNDIVKILPKTKPWELQRYALSSFKFQDLDKSHIILATPQQIEQTQDLLNPLLTSQETPTTKTSHIKTKILILTLITIISYTAVPWSLLQPIINPVIFLPAFSTAFTCSLILGKLLSQK